MSYKVWIGWMAGMVDGEGSIMINKANGKNFAGRITVTNTNMRMLRKVRAVAGCGNIRVSNPGTKNVKETYVWQCDRREDLQDVLEMLQPYLVGKARQARILLRFLVLGPAKIGARSALREVMKQLNRRGPQCT